ncbi:nitroreductase family protein [Staphylococcus simulans]|uniref:nitroreductase family protein n=1 Tax=Staphylococcus simulans TaxID=1286 RepID=UPI0021CE1C8E|nr:nitroreductase family protein [Staphylococcus simulans]UXV41967.1 nitroreductase family protein [Staphylococcus simulans]
MEKQWFDDVLRARKSVKVYDPNVKISHEEMDEMLGKAALAPSSINMQPWRVVVVDSEKGKEKVRPAMQFNTRQNDTSAAMVVIFGDLRNYEYGEQIYQGNVDKGYMPQETKDDLLSKFLPFYKGLSLPQMTSIVNIDCSLFAMQFMLVAKAHGYDTNPIGGFDRENIASILGLDPERYVPVMVVAVGKADQAAHHTYRLDVDAFRRYF